MRTTFLCVTWRAKQQLALEAAHLVAARVLVAAVAGQNRLDGDRHAEVVVVGLVDGAHAAAPEHLEDGVAGAELGAGRQLRAGLGRRTVWREREVAVGSGGGKRAVAVAVAVAGDRRPRLIGIGEAGGNGLVGVGRRRCNGLVGIDGHGSRRLIGVGSNGHPRLIGGRRDRARRRQSGRVEPEVGLGR